MITITEQYIKDYKAKLDKIAKSFDLDKQKIIVEELTIKVSAPDFWDDFENATTIIGKCYSYEHTDCELCSQFLKILDFNKVYMGDIILVSNEVGLGLVPENPLGRYFRDIAGSMNQIIAAESDEVYMVVSGIPVKIK